MKNYRITVNGTAYDVAVEELGAGAAPAAAPVATAPAAKAALADTLAAAPAAPLMVTCSWIPYLPSHLSSVLI